MKRVFLFSGVVGLVCTLMVGGIAHAKSEDLSRMLTKVKPAVVFIYVQVQAAVTIRTKEGPQTLPVEGLTLLGSGFLINPRGYLVTNGHVVQLYYENNEAQLRDFFLRKALLQHLIGPEAAHLSKAKILEKLSSLLRRYGPTAKVMIKKDLHVLLSNGKAYPGEVKAYSPPIEPTTGKLAVPGYHYKSESGKDISIIKIEDKDLPIVEMGDSDYVQLGESVYIVGYPGVITTSPLLRFQVEPTVTAGTISGTKLDLKGMPVIQTDAAITQGNSGGPGFTREGKVIGVATLASSRQGFNLLVPINTVKEFVRASGVPVGEKSLFNELWSQALGLYFQAQWRQALAKLEEVNQLHPNFPDVLKLRKEVLKRIHEQEMAGGLSVWVYVAIAAGVVVVALLILLLVRARSRPAAAPASVAEAEATRVVSAEVYGILVGEEGPVAGKVFKIGPKGLKIGRDPARNDIAVPDERVSREHAWVGPEEDAVVVKDLGSSNGTFLNDTDTRIKSQALKEGDVIILGKGRFASFKFKEA